MFLTMSSGFIRIVLPAYPVHKRDDRFVILRYMERMDQLWDRLAQIDHDIFSTVSSEHFLALQTYRKIALAETKMLMARRGADKATLNEHAQLLTRYRSSIEALGYIPVKRHKGLLSERELKHRQILKDCGLSPLHRDQLLHRYQARFSEWEETHQPWPGEPLQQQHDEQTSLLYFPKDKETLADLLGNGMRGLWFQPPLAAEKREAMGFLTWQPEHTLLLEARLGTDWSWPAIRMCVDIGPLHDSDVDTSLPVYMCVLGRRLKRLFFIIVLKRT